jgi:hypothetical protein
LLAELNSLNESVDDIIYIAEKIYIGVIVSRKECLSIIVITAH